MKTKKTRWVAPFPKGFLEGAIHHRRSSDRELNPKTTRKNFFSSECCGFLLLFIDLKNHCDPLFAWSITATPRCDIESSFQTILKKENVFFFFLLT